MPADGPTAQLLKAFKPGGGAPPPAYGGWVRFETDGVIRGWATDRNDRSARLPVQILIDGEPVATLRADRLDAKLKELGEGDGAYAFELQAPAAFRDGRPHRFEAHVRAGPGFQLRSKQDSFQTRPDQIAPTIEVTEAGWTGARGRILGQVLETTRLELWCDGQRTGLEAEQTLDVKRDRAFFHLRFDPARIAELQDRKLELALPGMVEAGLAAAPLTLPTGLEASGRGDDEVNLSLRGAPALFGDTIELRVRGEDGAVVHSEVISFTNGQAIGRMPPELAEGQSTVSVVVDGYEPARLRARPRRALPRLAANSGFERWAGDGPADWTIAEGVGVERGFHLFPPRIAARYGVRGDYAQLRAAGAQTGGTVVLLRQPVSETVAGNDSGELALLARASTPAVLQARLLGANGAEIAAVTLDADTPWVWAYACRTIAFDRPLPGAILELSAKPHPDDGSPVGELTVDVAGLRIGGALAFAEPSPRPTARSADVEELVVNADLGQWPLGLAFEAIGDRMETARGWSVVNRSADRPLHVRALPAQDDPDQTALAWAAEAVPVYARLEVLLDGAGVARLREGVLRFTAASPPAARRLLSRSKASAPQFSVIDRVMLMRRTTVTTAKGFRIADTVAATIARRLLVADAPHTFELPVRMEADPLSQLSAGETEGDAESFLVFQFRHPFAVAFSAVSLKAGAPAATSVAPYLQLEDRSIAAQAADVRGLEAWTSPETAVAPPPSVAAPVVRRHWRWSRAALGTVEVVVCVHNAPEETLACLRSLSTTTEVPHTVHVIDDASDPATAERLAAFVAERPWIRLTRHDENQGYTRSADEGVRAAETEWVVLLNSDAVLTPGWLEGLLEVAAADPEVAFVGPMSNAASFQSVPEIYGPDGKFAVNALPPGWSAADMAALVARVSDRAFPETPLLNGFCTLMRRSAVLELGGFNAVAFPAGYGEENDLCTRADKAGYTLRVADHVYVHHSKSASFGGERRGELAKAGSRALKSLHPDTDYAALTAAFRDQPALVRLREAVKRELGRG